MVLTGLLVPGKPFQDAGRKTTPSNGSPVVTKRQSAMISLRASATIMVLAPVKTMQFRQKDRRQPPTCLRGGPPPLLLPHEKSRAGYISDTQLEP